MDLLNPDRDVDANIAPLPTIVYLGNLPPTITPLITSLRSRFNIIRHTVSSEDEFLLHLQSPSSPLHSASAILRLGTHATTGLPLGWTAKIAELPAPSPPNLKLLVNLGHGLDTEDVAGVRARGIEVRGTAGGTDATATAGLYLAIAAFRQFGQAELAARSGDPTRFVAAMHAASRISADPQGKTVGILGYGRIGRRCGEMLSRALGMRACCVRRDGSAGSAGDGVIVYRSVDDMVSEVDCILLACPYTADTHHIIDWGRIQRMRRGVRIVNIARGKCVDEEALVRGIEEGIIGGAGLDVYEFE